MDPLAATAHYRKDSENGKCSTSSLENTREHQPLSMVIAPDLDGRQQEHHQKLELEKACLAHL